MKKYGWALILMGLVSFLPTILSSSAKVVWLTGAWGVFCTLLGFSLALFHQPLKIRRSIVAIAQSICLLLLLVGIFLSYKEIPGGNPIAMVAASLLSFFVSPLSFVNKYDRWKFYSKTKTEAFVLSFSDLIGKAGVILGVLFKFMHWPLANYMIGFGGSIFILSTLIWNNAFQKEVIRRKEAEDNIKLQKSEIEKTNEALHRQNEEIRAQRDEIEAQRDVVVHQKERIEEIHREISESINYATRLQNAILPDEKVLEDFFSEHFVLFKPKDKVSGDFYWWSHQGDSTVITAADCTGHGVPGAFMSMLGTSLLREIVDKEKVTITGDILDKLRVGIIHALKQNGAVGEQKDGMDLAIISINHATNTVQFSGANNPLYLLTNRDLSATSAVKVFENFYEIKADKMPVAIYEKMNPFTTHEIQLESGDVVYLFSDGFADQFGGPRGKKLNYKSFKRLLFENREKPLDVQKATLNNAFEDWKGRLEQLDDVVIVGVKIGEVLAS